MRFAARLAEAITVGIVSLLVAPLACGTPGTPMPVPASAGDADQAGADQIGGMEGAVTLFADRPWYRERPEPEQRWRGTLRKRPEARGPAARLGLAFELVTDEETLSVYAAGVEERLAPWVGKDVVLIGKRVDLAAEGFGPELWPAALRASGEHRE